MRILGHRKICNHVGQELQNARATLSVSSIVERVNDKDETGLDGKEERRRDEGREHSSAILISDLGR